MPNSHSNENSQLIIDSLEQLKHQTNNAIRSAKQSIKVYSQGLDPRILNNRDIEKNITSFVKKSRSSKVQLLIYNEALMRGVDHRLVALAQKFTSYIEIRIIPRDYHENLFGFYLIDNRTMLYRINIERYETKQLTMPDFLVKEKIKLFDSIWQKSTPASFLRALYL